MQKRPRLLSDALLSGEPSAWLARAPELLPFEATLQAWKRAFDRRGQPGSPETVQVYTHFAYCSMHCLFCQCWHALPRHDARLEAHVEYLIATLERYRRVLGHREVSNAAFGGGTPTLLSHELLRRFLDAFGKSFSVRHDMAWEGHPATLDDEKLEILAHGGGNRLSMGVQSFDPTVLKAIGRTNDTPERIEAIVRKARALGMFVNLDLVAGLPLQKPASVVEDALALMDMGPDMLTVYRYQPVTRLPDPPDPALALPALFPPRVLARAAAKRYFPITRIEACGYSVIFLRASPPSARMLVGEVRAALAGEVRRYTDFDRGDVHILGIGTGAISHLYGYALYREVRALRTTSADVEPLYWGSRTDPTIEARAAVLAAFGRGQPLSQRAIERMSGESIAPWLEQLGREASSSELVRRGDRFRLCAGLSAERKRELLTVLVRDLELTEPDARALLDTAHEVRARPDVQGDLVEIDQAVVRAHTVPADLVQVRRRYPELVALFVDDVGLRRDDRVEKIDEEGVLLRIESAPAAALRLVVGPPESSSHFFKTPRYAVSYKGASLTPGEHDALRDLAARAPR